MAVTRFGLLGSDELGHDQPSLASAKRRVEKRFNWLPKVRLHTRSEGMTYLVESSYLSIYLCLPYGDWDDCVLM